MQWVCLRSLSEVAKTREGFAGKIEQLITGRKIDESLYEELEELLIVSDVGIHTSLELVEQLRQEAIRQKVSDGTDLENLLRQQLRSN